LAYNHSLPNYNPWMRTNLYTTTDNKDEAKYVISGGYTITTDQSKSYNEKNAAETKDSIPYVYYEFTAKSSANITGNVIITDTETGAEVANVPYSKELSDEDKKVMQHASVKSPDSFVSTLSDYFVQAFRYRFSAVKATYKYDFPKIKPEDKELRKDFRKYRGDLKDLAKEGKLKELYSMYLEIQQKEDSPEVNECIGMCYEILGNYTQAKSYYDKSNSMDSKSRIAEQMNVQKQLRDLGIEVLEPEF
jgi:tetratricopeptide (TPR) repeat protein